MTNIRCAPLSIALLEEHAKSAVGFRIDKAILEIESLGNCSFHLCDGSVALQIDTRPVDTMHYERAAVHPRFRCIHEIGNGGTTGPGGVDECIGVEDGFKVLPFAMVAVN